MKKLNVLLVDDDDIFNVLNRKTLQTLDIIGKIDTCRNGSEALHLIEEYYDRSRALPEVILLDLNMPVMDGFGFIEAFDRLNMPNVDKPQIIVLTSSENARDVKRARDLGIINYIIKPLTVADLRAAVTFDNV
jgi:CheY-like chemotaxis protein